MQALVGGSMHVTVLIPARMQATRFPGKPLATLLGKPMIQWVNERSRQSKADRVLVATDSRDIYDAVLGFGGEARMTRDDHENGTQRIAEVAAQLETDMVVNVQGDEPTIHPRAVDQVIEALAQEPGLEMATLAEELGVGDNVFNPNVVKVVCNKYGRAMYFSRAPIPYFKHVGMDGPAWPKQPTGLPHYRHVGIYAYRTDFLLKYIAEAPCELENIEGLEQLRALYMGARIQVAVTKHVGIGVDTPDDLGRAEAYLKDHGA